MSVILIVLLVVFMALTVAALVRGVVALLRTKEAELMGTGGPTTSGLQQNRAMRSRILFQALAIVVVVLLLLLRKSG